MAVSLFPRLARRRLEAALADSPVVLLHGPRPCGKTTLARMVGDPAGYAYFSFDDAGTREVAETDPVGFIADLPPKPILDEVQHLPHVFATIKSAVDRDRRPGRVICVFHGFPASRRRRISARTFKPDECVGGSRRFARYLPFWP